jgi:membrane-associated phospholipid phosphatase
MHFPVKPLAFIFVALCLIREIRRGAFTPLGSYWKSVSPRPYLLLLAGTALLSGILILFADAPVAGWAKSLGCPCAAEISRIGGILGHGADPWCFIGAVYCLGILLKRPRIAQTSFYCLCSSALASGLTALLKYTFLRARPLTGLGPWSFFHPEGLRRHGGNFHSLASGDVAVVAAAAAYLFYSVKNFFFRSCLLLLPAMTAFSRIYKNKHWISDTVFATGLAFAAALFVFNYHRFTQSSENTETP